MPSNCLEVDVDRHRRRVESPKDDKRYRVSTAALRGSRNVARVKSYAGVCVTRSTIQRSSARMLPVRHAGSKPLDCSAPLPSQSMDSCISATSQISLEEGRGKRAAFQAKSTFTQHSEFPGVTSGNQMASELRSTPFGAWQSKG